MRLVMTSFKPEDVKDLFNKEFDFVSSVLSQVKLPMRVEDSGKSIKTCAFLVGSMQNTNKSKCLFTDIYYYFSPLNLGWKIVCVNPTVNLVIVKRLDTLFLWTEEFKHFCFYKSI